MSRFNDASPEPLSQLTPEACRKIRGIFTDIDDTLSLNGKIPSTAFSAMWRAQEAGLRVIPVTGRPAGWVDHIARMWPVDAVVGENGAFYFFLDPSRGRDGKLVRRFLQDAETRQSNQTKLFELFERLKFQIPELTVASDQKYREIDIAIDFCEDVDRLSERAIAEICEFYQRAGAQAKVSSIHVNAWFGEFNKFECCRLLLKELFQEAIYEEKASYIYVGDSPNDEPFFAEFQETSIGVANVRDFLRQMQHPPRYLTDAKGGEGFAQVVEHILQYR